MGVCLISPPHQISWQPILCANHMSAADGKTYKYCHSCTTCMGVFHSRGLSFPTMRPLMSTSQVEHALNNIHTALQVLPWLKEGFSKWQAGMPLSHHHPMSQNMLRQLQAWLYKCCWMGWCISKSNVSLQMFARSLEDLRDPGKTCGEVVFGLVCDDICRNKRKLSWILSLDKEKWGNFI